MARNRDLSRHAARIGRGAKRSVDIMAAAAEGATGPVRDMSAVTATDEDDASGAGGAGEPVTIGDGESQRERELTNTGSVTEFVEDYDICPLIPQSIELFAGDVMSPGYRFESDHEGTNEKGQTLPEALKAWCEKAGVTSGMVSQRFEDLAEQGTIDKRKRGDEVCQIVYDDRSTAETITGLRLIPRENLTAHVNPTTGILYQPDEDVPADVEEPPPTTPAGKTAAYSITLDDSGGGGGATVSATGGGGGASGGDEEAVVAYSADEIIRIPNHPDTGSVWGTSDIKPVHPRVRGLAGKMMDVDQAIASKAYKFWLFRMGSEDAPWPQDKAEEFLSTQRPENYRPDEKTAVPGDVSIDTVSGEVPEVWESMYIDAEWIMSHMPAPKYRVAFADDLNRDIAIRLQQDYHDDVRAERRRKEAGYHPFFERLAVQLGFEGEEAGTAPDFDFLIAEDEMTNPLRLPWFDAQEFNQLMTGLEMGAPGGEVSMTFPPRKQLEILLELDPGAILGDGDGGSSALSQEDVDAAVEEAGGDTETETPTPDAPAGSSEAEAD